MLPKTLLITLLALVPLATSTNLPEVFQRADKFSCYDYCRDYCCINRCYDTIRLNSRPCGAEYLDCCHSCDCFHNQACEDKCRKRETKCRQPDEDKLYKCLDCCKASGESFVPCKKEEGKCVKRYNKCQDPTTVFETCIGAPGTVCVVKNS